LYFTAPSLGPLHLQGLLEEKYGYLPASSKLFAQVTSMTADGRCSLPVSYTWPIH
jgi:hypothetical protein